MEELPVLVWRSRQPFYRLWRCRTKWMPQKFDQSDDGKTEMGEKAGLPGVNEHFEHSSNLASTLSANF